MLWVIAYDIRCDQRRRRVAAILEDHGARVQYSVFECHLSAWQSRQLQRALLEVLNLQEDSLCWYPQCRWCAGRREARGVAVLTGDVGYVVV